MKYEYKSPLDMGYEKVRVDRKKWNKLFPHDSYNFNWKQKIDVYFSEDKGFIFEIRHTLLVKCWVVLCYPFYLLLEGLSNVRELHMEYREIFYQDKTGSFKRDVEYPAGKYYEAMKECIK